MGRVKASDNARLEEHLKEILRPEEPKPEVIPPHEAKIIDDGKQYAVRIPNKMALAVGLDVEKDSFVFKVVIHQYSKKSAPTLVGELKRGM